MVCKNCGAQIPDNSLYCEKCGHKTEKSEIIFCKNCGAMIEYGSGFCGSCGHPLNDTDFSYKKSPTPYEPETRKKAGKTVVIIILITVLVLSIGVVAGYLAYCSISSPNEDENLPAANTSENTAASTSPEAADYSEPTVKASPVPVQGSNKTPAPEAVNQIGKNIPKREDLYNSSLTYKRMPDIHNTVLTDDETFDELKTVIEQFDRQCEDYMNEITDEVPSYLKRGTTAYNQQVEFKQKHPSLNQTFESVNVINSRYGGGYYYVWAAEVLNTVEDGKSETETDHWVYKIENNNGEWYICDYTRDPAF